MNGDVILTAFVTIVVAALSSPLLIKANTNRVKRQMLVSLDGAEGWRVAIDQAKERIEDLEEQNKKQNETTNQTNAKMDELQREIDGLEKKVRVLTGEVRTKDAVISQQSKAITARDSRIGQLSSVLRANGLNVPAPDPAIASDL